MAQNKQIKITGVSDFSAIEKDAKKIQKTIGDVFGGKAPKLFDENTFKIMQAGFKTTFANAKSGLEHLKRDYSTINGMISAGVESEKEMEALKKQQLSAIAKIADAERLVADLRKQGAGHGFGKMDDVKVKQEIQGTGGVSAVGGAAMNAASAMPGVGGAVSAAGQVAGAGMEATAMGLGGPIAGVVAGLVGLKLAIEAVTDRYQEYKATIDDRLAIAGQGQKPMVGGKVQADYERLGYDMTQAMAAQKSAAGAMGVNKDQEKDQSRLINIMTMARQFGMKPERFTGASEQLRSAGGTKFAQESLSKVMDNMQKAQREGMDKSQIPHLLTAQIGLLTQINKEGYSNSSALLGVVTSLAARGGGSPEQYAKQVGGMNQAIAGSTGEANAFFQNAYANAGLGGGSMLGTQFAVGQGFQGANFGKLQKDYGIEDTSEAGKMQKDYGIEDTSEAGKMLTTAKGMNLGGEDFTQQAAKSINESLKRLFEDNDAGRVAKAAFLNKSFGGSTMADATKTQAVLSKLQSGKSLTKEDEKIAEKITKGPEKDWQDKVISNLEKLAGKPAIDTLQVTAILKDVRIGTGEKVADFINAQIKTAIDIEKTVSGQDKDSPKMPIPQTKEPLSLMGGGGIVGELEKKAVGMFNKGVDVVKDWMDGSKSNDQSWSEKSKKDMDAKEAALAAKTPPTATDADSRDAHLEEMKMINKHLQDQNNILKNTPQGKTKR